VQGLRKKLGAVRSGQRRMAGFNLIEIMIVLVLIGLMTTLAVVFLNGQLKKGKIRAARSMAYEISKSLELFNLDYSRYPTPAEGLNALVNPPRGGDPYLKNLPVDPWGNEYLYINPGEVNKGQPDVRSKGPDGVPFTEDDIGNWPEETEPAAAGK